jgi:hydroxyacyl-ACP dehydratase HTD2-like protein with hotdog domain
MSPLPNAAALGGGAPQLPFALPELWVSPTPAQVFMFSAVTWNRHHIHYSAEAAKAEGHAGVVVQRGLIGNFLARLLTRWLGRSGEVRKLSWKVVKSVLPGQAPRCQGEVIAAERRGGKTWLTCALRMVDAGGDLVAEGRAELELEV